MLTGHGKQSGCSLIQDPALVDVHHTGYCYLQLGNPGISKPTKSWESCKSESQVEKFTSISENSCQSEGRVIKLILLHSICTKRHK